MFPGPALTQLWERPGLQQEWPNPLAEIAQIPWVPAQHLAAYGEMKSVISPQWHYIVHEEFGEELYDWSVDPAESTDLVENPELSSVVDQLRDDLDMFIATLSAWLDWSRFPS